MNRKFIDIAIQAMDSQEVLDKFNLLCNHGSDGECLIRFLNYILPLYEEKKKETLTKVIQACYTSLLDGIWEDPLDTYLYGRLNELEQLAKELEIDIKTKKNAV